MIDLSLKERMDLFNDNNMSLCESMCTFKGYEYNNIICECKIKVKFNSFLNVNASKYNLIYRFEHPQSNNLNFWVVKCFLNLFTIDSIIKNLCSIIILGILFIAFIGAIFFCIKENDMLNSKIYILIESTLKKEEENFLYKIKKISFSRQESDFNRIFKTDKFDQTNDSKRNLTKMMST